MPSAHGGGSLDCLETARLRGERLRPGHLAEIRRMHEDPDCMAELGGVQTADQTRAYMARNLAHWDRYGHGLWIVHERGGTEPIGRAVLRHVAVNGLDEVEIGYAFYAPYRRRGYATEVTEACTALGFERLGLASVVALTSEGNVASHGVLGTCGFTREGLVVLDGATLLLFRRIRR